ncbi:hypothetical protein BPS13_0132 [Bacillus phage BPS13]|uniref:Uncharacterized protein n=3 Tax=Wphvirus TaxID=1922327 RepID=W5QUJ4_9CAUD|nr:hypothetical protein BPS13_0132 [Bacillus phage BPS13]YP_009003017.1 hypothetical protein BPS10C_131 [Bacillus phage BPS10C]YP_009282180.1 hypothetical protein SALINJAH_226 [Bacillus phage SalinJah]AEZ50311.1 hypothetical protein BPS13_0132 [Bacillus phage BPS13]AGI12128.1 hypothetical protein BPS10C_131 [Bacillus phage BPS10C]ANH50834.1 hypothetical protein SALINJAH_226 [Bacillus phage SalinJah]
MKIFQGIATALAAAYISVFGVILLQMAVSLDDESLRGTSLGMGIFSIVLVVLLVVPYAHKAITGKDW